MMSIFTVNIFFDTRFQTFFSSLYNLLQNKSIISAVVHNPLQNKSIISAMFTISSKINPLSLPCLTLEHYYLFTIVLKYNVYCMRFDEKYRESCFCVCLCMYVCVYVCTCTCLLHMYGVWICISVLKISYALQNVLVHI